MKSSANRYGVYKASELDFRLKPNARVVDKGVALPNINDGFNGKAPDLGAIEAGTEMPVYGVSEHSVHRKAKVLITH